MDNLINKIHNCNNRDILKQLPDKSIQVFLEDMPYGITACKWDTMPDLKEYWELRLSKIKDNGCFVLFGCQPFTTDLINSNRQMFKYEMIWDKILNTQPFLSKIKPLQIHENILIFYNKKNLYNPQKHVYKNIETIKRQSRSIGYTKSKSEHYNHINKKMNQDVYKFPESIIIIKNKKRNNQFKKVWNHPTQKPIALFEYLIKTYSNENDLIFDGFSGSGTTAIACYNTNRNFICCELEKEYYDKSVKRLKEVKNNLFDNIM